MTDPFPNSSSSKGTSEPDMRHSLLRARIAKLPQLPAIAPHSMPSSSSNTSSNSMPPPSSSSSSLRKPQLLEQDYTPLTSEDCFEQALEIDVAQAGEGNGSTTFRVYFTPPKLAAPEPGKEEKDEDRNGTLFVMHHGAGYSALSFALMAREVTKLTKGRVGVLAVDCRGHGKTRQTPPESEAKLDMSLAQLTSDMHAILRHLYPSVSLLPNLVLIGHSMGGSVVVSLADALLQPAARETAEGALEEWVVPASKLAGVAVLDVVEGTAISALPGMREIVLALPTGFKSVEEAVKWHVESGTLLNVESARRSVAGLLKPNDKKESEGETTLEGLKGIGGIIEEEEEEEEEMEELSNTAMAPTPAPWATNAPALLHAQHLQQRTLSTNARKHALVWRADLLATEPYWRGWFEGLSRRFVAVRCPRLLVLAGTDRLDRELMIGQMQGKYQLAVFPETGHSLQEDAPEKTAATIVEFWERNARGPILPLKVKGGLRKVGQ